jgi:hypothetical protein
MVLLFITGIESIRLGIIDGGEMPIKVRLLFEPELAGYITERQSHPSQGFHMRRDGRVQMRFATTSRGIWIALSTFPFLVPAQLLYIMAGLVSGSQVNFLLGKGSAGTK